MPEGVQADKVGCSEHGCFGAAHGRTEQGVHFRNGHPVFEHQLHGFYDALDADPVADEVRGVFGPHDAFTQNPFAIVRHEIQNFRQGLFAGDDFKQLHVSDGVEKMGAQKMLPELFAEPFGHGLERNPGCVGRDNGSSLSDRLDALEKILFDLEVFNHDLDNPVATGKFVKIIFKVADGDQVYIFLLHEQGRP